MNVWLITKAISLLLFRFAVPFAMPYLALVTKQRRRLDMLDGAGEAHTKCTYYDLKVLEVNLDGAAQYRADIFIENFISNCVWRARALELMPMSG